MAQQSGKKIAMNATDGVEQVDLTGPRDALNGEGATVTVIAPKSGQIQGMNHDEKGDKIQVDATLDSVRPDQFDAMILPGGVANPDKLRVNKDAMAFIKAFTQSGKPVAAICHGPWTLINAGGVKGKTMTSWPSLETDLRNAGAHWVDQDVVVDHRLVTSRKPDDLPVFCARMIEEFAERVQAQAAE